MTANTQQEDAGRRSAGGNKGPRIGTDPGPAADFLDIGPLALRQQSIDPEELAAFYTAIRTQGNDATRQLAITNTLHRARANPNVTHRAYRVLEEVASRCRWAHRYHSEPLEATAFFTGQSGASNVGRILRELSDAGFAAVIMVPRKAGGRPMTFCTIVCTSDDRSGQSWEMLRAQARERYNGAMRAKRNGCDWPLPDTPEPAIRQGDGLAKRCHDALDEQDNASPQRNAMRCHNDQTVNSSTEKITDLGEVDRGADASFLEAEIILPTAFPLVVSSVIRDEDREVFRGLYDTFGQRPGAIIAAPTPRTITDPILDGVVRDELGGYLYDEQGAFSPDIAQRGLGSALRATAAAGRRGGAGGPGSMVSFFEKTLRTKVADVQRAEHERIAKLRVEGEVQQDIAEKRVRGMREGGARATRNSASWSDILGTGREAC